MSLQKPSYKFVSTEAQIDLNTNFFKRKSRESEKDVEEVETEKLDLIRVCNI